jgi:hypothetical protein
MRGLSMVCIFFRLEIVGMLALMPSHGPLATKVYSEKRLQRLVARAHQDFGAVESSEESTPMSTSFKLH